MGTKFRNLKNDLEDLEKSGQLDIEESSSRGSSGNSSKLANYILLFAFLASLVFYTGSRFNFTDINFNPIEEITQAINEPDEDLLNRMGTWMTEMGYGELSREELIDLRSEGVTATFTSQIRELGYTDVTLEQLVELQQADVSATFARMMQELGYELTIEDLIELRRNGVTAHFTSNMYDLGYTAEELTTENLARLRSIGVTHNLAERLIEERGERPTIDELIRYRISNQ